MSVRIDHPFRAAIAAVREGLGGRDRILFDLLCAAGQLGYRLPDDDVNVRHASGARDPRRRLELEFPSAGRVDGWSRVAERLAKRLRAELAERGGGEYRPLRVLLAYAPSALAPDCVLPRDPLLRAAWKSCVGMFAGLFPSVLRPLGRLDCVEPQRLAVLRREAARGLAVGRRASGLRPGREGRRLAVDPSLMALVGGALRKGVAAGFQARYLFYTKPGDHIWPHPDDPKFSVSVLLCIEHELAPGRSAGSAFLAYRPDGSIERHELSAGRALAVEPGLVHAREPVQPGERVIMLSIGLTAEG
jgi:hypothetical protein